MNKVDAARELLRRKVATESFRDFLVFMETGFEFSAHHVLMIKELESVERGDTRNLMLMLPPGSAKSTYSSIYFPSWYLGRNPKNCVIACSHTLELAERFGRRARNVVGNELFRLLFDLGLSPDSQAAGRWETGLGGEYFAAGVGGSITGRRADLGIIDDPVKSREAADSEVQREMAWQWYLNDFLTRLKPGARQVVVQTRWHEDDLAGRILEREADQWRVISLPMEAEGGDPLGRKEGELLWPEWFDQEMVDRAKADARSWSALYQQRPRPVGGGEFRRDWVNFYQSQPDGMKDSTNRYILVDAANEKRKGNDYTAMWVVGLGHDSNVYVLDLVRDRLNLTERTSELFRLHRKWKPMDVRYEKYGMMTDIEHIKTVQDSLNYRFHITEVGGDTPKNDRIRRLIPYFERNRMWFPSSLHRTMHDGVTRELINDFVEKELLAFPVGKHDDMLDSLARLVEPELSLTWPSQEEEYKPRRYEKKVQSGSVWTA